MSVGSDLRQYMFNFVMLLKIDIEEQFIKWNHPMTGFHARYLAAHKAAVAIQREVLDGYANEHQRSTQRSLFVLQIVSLPVLSWLGAALEQKVGVKVLGTYIDDGFLPQSGYVYSFTRKWVRDEFKSKIAGDYGQNLASTLATLGLDKLSTTPQPTVRENVIAFSENLDAFAQNLHAEVELQRSTVVHNLVVLAKSIIETPGLEKGIIDRLRRVIAGFDRMPPDRQLSVGKANLAKELNGLRDKWASSYYYYGFDPPTPVWAEVTRFLELQMWAVWVVQQRLHSQNDGIPSDYKVKGASGFVFNDIQSFASTVRPSPIQSRLFELQAPLMDYQLDPVTKRHSEEWADRQAKKMRDWAEERRGLDYEHLVGLLRAKKRVLDRFGDR